MWQRIAIGLVVLLSGCDVVQDIANDFRELEAEVEAEFEAEPMPPNELTPPTTGGFYRMDPPPSQPVELYDKGIGMVRSTVTPPPGWNVYHDIDTDPQSLQSRRFILDYVGPQGQLIRGIQASKYWAMKKERFTPSWQASVRGSLPGVENLQFSKASHSERLAATPMIQKYSQMMKLEPLEAKLTGTHDGKLVEGYVYIAHFPLGPQIGGTFSAMVVLAPQGLGEATAEVMSELSRTEIQNPEFDARMAQLTNQLSRRSAQQHQARMQQRQAAFDAHQARMRSQSQTFDAANQQWLNNFRGSGSGSGSGYTGQDQIVDTIHERNSFAAPDGQRANNNVYKYNFTDGQGNFYGTDDPSFNPASLQGDWQATQPLRP